MKLKVQHIQNTDANIIIVFAPKYRRRAIYGEIKR
jgi:hypothetical protein